MLWLRGTIAKVAGSPEIRESIEACVAQKGASVVELLVRGGWDNPLYEVFIDNEKGVTLEFCSEVSRDIKSLLDRTTSAKQYRLTVSSPGLERSLKFPWQYKKHVGRLIQVKHRRADGLEETTGRLASSDESGLVVRDDQRNEDVCIAYDAVLEAKLRTLW